MFLTYELCHKDNSLRLHFLISATFYSVKKGGPSLVSNKALADLLEKFKELDVPKEIFERNVKKASEKGQEAYIEKVYEVFKS